MTTPEWALGVVAADGRQDLEARFRERGRTPQDFGAVGDGVTDDTAALQAWLDAIADGGRGILPNGIYAHDGTLSIAGFNIVIQFEDDAWLAPTAGWGLKCDLSRGVLYGPRILLTGSTTATRGLWLNTSTRCTVRDPIIWAMSDPTGCIGIDVDDNSYWCKIENPHIRKNSGSIAGSFDAGVRVQNASNAGRVYDGSISHCVDGVQVDGSNAVSVIGVAFEDCAAGIALLDGVGCPAFLSLGNRFESCTYSLDIRQQAIAGQKITHISLYEDTRDINNPNGVPLAIVAPGGVSIPLANQSVTFGSTAAVRLQENNGNATLNANGNVTLTADKDSNGSGRVSLEVADVEIAAAEATRFTVRKEFSHQGTTVGFFKVTPVSRPAALTQTYSTADRTLGAYTADVESAAYTGQDNAQAGAVYANLADLNALRAAYENLRAFVEDLAQHHNALVDDLQALGLEQ